MHHACRLTAVLLFLSLCSSLGLAQKRSSEPRPRRSTEPRAVQSELKIYPTLGRVERLDPALDALVPPGAVIEQLADGFAWSEGPVWVRNGSHLLFSDVPKNVVYKWARNSGITEFMKPSGYTGDAARGGEPGSNGLTFDSAGRLILCQHGDRQVARREKDGKVTVLTQYYQYRRFNSPNDLVYKSNGDLYFTDPPYGLLKLNDDPAKELSFNGVYRLTKNGETELLVSNLSFPNGIAFSPDEKTLYVAVSDPKRAVWMAYDVLADGSLGKNGRVLFDATSMTGTRKGLPDGLKVDVAGNLFATGPGGVLVLSPQGKHLGTIDTGEPTANCAWGENGSVLYITANNRLCRIKTSTRGKMP
ncbi:MAG: SMP-30/gluconolactonase/LRE family protein [Verrucomicrobiia bacterium]